MSRIGKNPITIPSGVEVKLDGTSVTVKGPKGTLSQEIDASVNLDIAEGVITLSRESDAPAHRAKHGLYRALINNMIVGVSEGYKKEMEVVGVGYRATAAGQRLELALGFSHPIVMELPYEIKVSAETAKGQPPLITLESHDKQLIGQVAAKIRSFRKPEPYKGKGIKFKGEQIRRKAGKSAGKK
jgi:large subunit ribosomal protein L6